MVGLGEQGAEDERGDGRDGHERGGRSGCAVDDGDKQKRGAELLGVE